MPMSDQFRAKRLAALSAIAKKHGGKVTTRRYSVLRAPMSLECANGHRFTMTPKNLLRGLWCSKCRPLSRQTEFYEAAKKYAAARGGKLVSSEYKNARTSLEWQCAERHRWKASLDNVTNKHSWCPHCSLESASDRKKSWWRQQKRKSPAKKK